ncbi:hypothetical protein [Halorubrum laminariae]|uniref:Uncharacterized protein n=1 Tax=Halorubrum laminariae TaxID=1433523 RepID=A0ABD6C1Y2_9EURY|nr:hypothetical protein [Halorubrum laminariae]
MGPTPADRGQSNVVGFILIFGFLLVSYSLFQAYVIPNQNAEIEYQHYQDVRDDMTDLYAEIITLSESSSDRQVLVPVDLGMYYPSRLLFLNPPPAAGSIRSSTQGAIQIGGANATEICGGSDTTGLIYSPSYRVTNQPDLRYENGLLYVEADNGANAMLEQRPILTGDTINLYRLSGTLRTQSGTDTLPLEITGPGTSDNSATGVSVTNVTLRSDLPAEEWNQSVLTGDQSELHAVTVDDDTVRIEGFSGNYDVRCHSVGLGQRP